MKKFKHPIQKIFLMLTAVIAASYLIFPKQSLADLPVANAIGSSILGVLGEGFSYIIFDITYVIGYIASLVITLGGHLIEIFLGMNRGVLQSRFVLSGFGITLSIANLGFVLAIIIIAFTTILRLEGYSMKQMLRNLVIAAVLVNFSLGIAGVFIDFTGTLSEFFIQKATSGSLSDFSTSLASAFNLSAIQKPTQDPSTLAGLQSAISSFGKSTLVSIASLFFVVIFIVIVLITMYAIAMTILVRYLYLSILLVLMPIAWLFWVIPQLKGYFSDWWHTFIKWNFFLPAALFFLYLVITAVNGIADLHATASVSDLSFLSGTLSDYAQMIVAIAMAAGGLIVANKMGIKGAEGAMKAATGFKNYIAERARVNTATLTGARPLARGTAKVLNNRFVRWIPGAKSAVSGLEKFSQRKDEVEAYQKRYLGNLSKDRFSEVQKTSPTGAVAKAAFLAESVKRGDLGGLNMSEYLTEDMKNMFNRNNQGKSFSDMEKSVGMNTEMMKLFQTAAKTKSDGDIAALHASSMKFMASFSDSDKKKLQADDAFKDKKAFGLEGDDKKVYQSALAYGIADSQPGLMGTIVPKMKTENIENFSDAARKASEELLKMGEKFERAGDKVKSEEYLKRAANAADSLKKNMAKRVIGGFEEPESPKPEEPKPAEPKK